jgi:cytochrome c
LERSTNSIKDGRLGETSTTLDILVMKSFYMTALSVAGMVAAGATAAEADRKPGSNEFFSFCSGCHSIYCNRTGPKLKGVVGRKSGSVTDFKDYSDAFKTANIVWTADKIDKLLQSPQTVVPGGRMGGAASQFTKASPDERRKIIQFLQDPDRSAERCP